MRKTVLFESYRAMTLFRFVVTDRQPAHLQPSHHLYVGQRTFRQYQVQSGFPRHLRLCVPWDVTRVRVNVNIPFITSLTVLREWAPTGRGMRKLATYSVNRAGGSFVAFGTTSKLSQGTFGTLWNLFAHFNTLAKFQNNPKRWGTGV